MGDLSLIEWLTKILDEDEENVQSEIRFSNSRDRDLADWGKYVYDPIIGPYGGQTPQRDAATGMYIAKVAAPLRVLADIEAKRAIVKFHQRRYCSDCRPTSPCETVRLLASAYADRPGYREVLRLDVCPTCHGLSYVPDFTNWDEYHGEPKPKPCPVCSDTPSKPHTGS